MRKEYLLSLFTFPFISISALAQWTGTSQIPLDISNGGTGNGIQLTRIADDEYGGAIVVWCDVRTGNLGMDIWANKLDGAGNRLWGTGGIRVHQTSQSQRQFNPELVADGSGGAFIVWEDARAGIGLFDIWGQHLDANGTRLWGTNGVLIAASGNTLHDQTSPEVVRDDAGGITVVYNDNRNSTNAFDNTANNWDLYAQRVDAAGTLLWSQSPNPPSWGIPVSNATGHQTVTHDGANMFNHTCVYLYSELSTQSVYLTWEDTRSGTAEVYAQRIDYNGNFLWAANGVNLARGFTAGIAETNDGIIIAYENGTWEIWATRLDRNANPLWSGSAGVLIKPGAGGGWMTEMDVVSDGSNGLYIAFREVLTPSVLRVDCSGAVAWGPRFGSGIHAYAPPSPMFRGRVRRNPAGGATFIWLRGDPTFSIPISDPNWLFAAVYDENGNEMSTPGGFPVADFTSADLWRLYPAITRTGNTILAWADQFNFSSTINCAMNVARICDLGLNCAGVASGAPSYSYTPCALVSLTFLSFSGKRVLSSNKEYVGLQWKTSGYNTEGEFVIERATIENNFKTIGNLKSKISTRNNYSFEDDSPAGTILYYRIKYSEGGGTNKNYSEIIEVSPFSQNDEMSISNIFPNPAGGSTEILFSGFITDSPEHGTILVTNTLGQTAISVPVNSGSLKGNKITLPLSRLENGVYFVRYTDKEGVKSQGTKLIVENR